MLQQFSGTVTGTLLYGREVTYGKVTFEDTEQPSNTLNKTFFMNFAPIFSKTPCLLALNIHVTVTEM